MQFNIDTEAKVLEVKDKGKTKSLDLYGQEAFELISDIWLKTSWNQKYSYTFTWMGRPIIQHPEDMVRLQEVIYTLQPDVIIETGVAHGGSLTYMASLLKAMGKGRVVGVDIEIRPHNRQAIESHALKPLITLIEGNSVDPKIVAKAAEGIKSTDTVLVILDSNHTKDHVAAELEAYYHLVSVGSYIAATDGIMQILHDVPRGKPSWREDNPVTAVQEFVKKHPEFVMESPAWRFNESNLSKNITAWPCAWLRRTS